MSYNNSLIENTNKKSNKKEMTCNSFYAINDLSNKLTKSQDVSNERSKINENNYYKSVFLERNTTESKFLDKIKIKVSVKTIKSNKIKQLPLHIFMDFKSFKDYLEEIYTPEIKKVLNISSSNNTIASIFLLIGSDSIEFNKSYQWEKYFIDNPLSTIKIDNKIRVEFSLKDETTFNIEQKINNTPNITSDFLDLIKILTIKELENIDSPFHKEISQFLDKNVEESNKYSIISTTKILFDKLENKVNYKINWMDNDNCKSEILNSQISENNFYESIYYGDDLKSTLPSFTNYVLNNEIDGNAVKSVIISNNQQKNEQENNSLFNSHPTIKDKEKELSLLNSKIIYQTINNREKDI